MGGRAFPGEPFDVQPDCAYIRLTFALDGRQGRCESKIGIKSYKEFILYHFMQYLQVAEDERLSGKRSGNPHLFGQNALYMTC